MEAPHKWGRRMPRIEVAYFEITATAVAKFWARRIDQRQVTAVLFGRTVVTRNQSGRAAPYILFGRDEQGRCLAIPIVPTDDPIVWRPITAWYCKQSEAAKLR